MNRSACDALIACGYPVYRDAMGVLIMIAVSMWLLCSNKVSAKEINVSRHNCVDQCVVEFAECLGTRVTESDFASAISTAGLDSGPVEYRSLSDCIRILDSIGIPTCAVRLRTGSKRRLPAVCIVYLPSRSPSVPGHVCVLSAIDEMSVLIFDPARPEGQVRSKIQTDSLMSIEAVAIVPKTLGRRFALDELFRSLLLSLSIGVLGSGFALLLRSNKWPRSARSLTKGQLVISGILPLLVGCELTSDDRSVRVAKTDIDFGVIESNGATDSIDCTFRLDNQSESAIEVSAIKSSCSCIIAIGDLTNKPIKAKDHIDIPVSVSLSNRLGPFVERLVIQFQSDDLPDVVLTVRGFVASHPVPSTDPFVLRAPRIGRCSQFLDIVYVRYPGERQTELGDFGIVHDGETSSSRLFTVQSPTVENRVSGSGSRIDIWKFKVDYAASNDAQAAAAKIKLDWIYPNISTFVELRGELLAPIELHSGEIVIPDVTSLRSHTESIPVRINDEDAARHISLVSKNGIVTGQLDVEARRLNAVICATKPGRFEDQLRFELNDNVISELDFVGVCR